MSAEQRALLRQLRKRLAVIAYQSVVRTYRQLHYWTVVAALWLLRPLMRIRIATIAVERVGHFVPETDLAIALLAQGRTTGAGRDLCIFVLPPSPCNEVLEGLYERALSRRDDVKVLHSADSRLARLLTEPGKRLAANARSGGSRRFFCGSPVSGGIDQCGWTQHDRPYVRLSTEQIQDAESVLDIAGMQRGDMVACVHIRDEAYLRDRYPGRDWSYHDFRNPAVDPYIPTIETLLTAGYFVVRTGRIAERPLPLTHPRLLDYAFWPKRSDLLDVYLYSRASLCLSGGPSGIDQLGTMFNRPTAVTNLTPLEDLRYALPNVIVSPTLLREKATGRMLGLSEMLANRLERMAQFHEAGLEIVQNTSQDIWATVNETIMRSQGSWVDTPDAIELQASFWEAAVAGGIEKAWLPDDPWRTDYDRARISAHFLQKHRDLLLK